MPETLPIAGRFVLQAIAGSGGMGVVHRAQDLQTGRTVAVKVMRSDDPEANDRFLREAEVLARMVHGGIVQHVAHGQMANGQPYLAMEWLDGEDLADRLQRGPLAVADAARMCAEVADALAFAHAAGVVHRDLKPGNVFLVGRDLAAIRLLDFGIARLQQAPSAATRTGTVIGTPAYMAPEQARGERGLDARADLFSLGCVLYECLAGRPPFVADSAMAVLIKVLLEEPPPLLHARSDVPPGLVALVSRLLAKRPADRPHSALAVAAVLRDIGTLAFDGVIGSGVPAALTRHERRIVTLVVVADPWPGERPPEWAQSAETGTVRDADLDATLLIGAFDPDATVQTRVGSTLQGLQRRLAALGVGLHRLVDGTLLASPTGTPHAAELALRAGRCAVLLHEALPDVPIVIATGYGVSTGEAGGDVAVGEAIEAAARALRGLRAASERGIALDDATVGLLGGRFDVARTQGPDRVFPWRLSGMENRGDAAHTQSPRPSLLGRATPCVGRGRELSVLRALFDSCQQEGGAKVVVTAPSGLGKSRIVDEFLADLRRSGARFQLWSARAEAIGQDTAHGMLAALLAHVADLQAGMADAERALRVQARVDCTVPSERREAVLDFARLVLCIDPSSESQRLRAAREDPALMTDLVREGLAAWLQAEARAATLVILIDDLQWVDRLTLRAIGAVHDMLQEEPILFLGLARPEVHDRFPTLRSDPRVLEMRLGPLPRRASEQLVRSVLGATTSPEQVDQIVGLASGEAFYLEELIRAAATGQHALPTTVLAMAQSRIDALEPEARRVLRAASIFGMRCWADGVAELAGGSVAAELERLVVIEVLAPAPRATLHGQQELSFRHAFLREAAYAMLTDADRTLGHRLAGRWLAWAGETDPVVLATHLDKGGEPAAAQGYYALAAEQALVAADLHGARRWLDCGLNLAMSGEGRARLMLVAAELQMGQGDSSAAMACAQEAVAGFRPGTRHWYRAMAEIGRSQVRGGRLHDAPSLVTAFLAPEPEPDALEVAIFCAARLAVNVLFVDLVEAGDQLIAFAESNASLANPRPGEATMARLAGARSSRKALEGDLAGAMVETRFALETFHRLGDLRNAAAQQLDLGVLYVRAGLYAAAETEIVQSTAVFYRLGLVGQAVVGRVWQGATAYARGRIDEGIATLQETAVQMANHGVALPMCWCLFALASALLARGDLKEAEVQARRLVALAEAVTPMLPQALALLARICVAAGHAGEPTTSTEAVVAMARKAIEWSRADGSSEERGIVAHLALAEALHAHGDRLAARQVALQGHALLQRMAARMPDLAMRHAYLHVVPEHRLLAQWANLG